MYASTHTRDSGLFNSSPNNASFSEEDASNASPSTKVSTFTTNETFGCTKDLEDFLKKANLTIFETFPCDAAKSLPPTDGYPCQVNPNRKYKVSKKNHLAEIYTPSAKLCCNLCRAMRDCYSWWRKYSNGRCYLNGVYTRSSYSSSSSGGNI